jgi:hypothetical protein
MPLKTVVNAPQLKAAAKPKGGALAPTAVEILKTMKALKIAVAKVRRGALMMALG